MMNQKCLTCPLLGLSTVCPGQNNTRVCAKADPSNEAHDANIIPRILEFANQPVVKRASELTPEDRARLGLRKGCGCGGSKPSE